MYTIDSESDGPLRKPIIIIGAPRSGTTMMGNILSRHPDLTYLEEPRLTWRYGNDRRSDMLEPGDARPEVIDHIRRSFYQSIASRGRTRLLEKTPSNSLRLGFVDRVFPDCKFIHIIRDGTTGALAIRDLWTRHAYGVTGLAPGRIRQRLKEARLSQLPYYGAEVARRLMPTSMRGLLGPNVWGPRIPGLEGMARDMPLLEVCAIQWRVCVERACSYGRTLPNDRYMQIRLEDISGQMIRSVMDFCELPGDPAVADFAQSIFRKDRPSSRLDGATPYELQVIRRWVEPTMNWIDSQDNSANTRRHRSPRPLPAQSAVSISLNRPVLLQSQ